MTKVIMIGATGAVGTEAVKRLMAMPEITQITLLGRRAFDSVKSDKITNHIVDVFEPDTYTAFLASHDYAICTFGVGESSKVSKQEFERTDKTAVLAFGAACKQANVKGFALLCSVAANAKSPSFYLRIKGELQNGLIALGFDRLSLFQPSMILTPKNRYGFSQAMVLAIWPKIDFLLAGPLKKYRGVKVATLGRAIANSAIQAR